LVLGVGEDHAKLLHNGVRATCFKLCFGSRIFPERFVAENVEVAGRIDLVKAPCLESAFEAVEVGSAFEELGQDDLDELFFVGDAEGAARWEPGYGVCE
jgi:hypothetical protein